MCGRFEIHSAIEIIAKIFGIDPAIFDIKPNYNVAPSQDVAVVVNVGKKKRLISCRWGFVPSWSKELKTGLSTINARAETISTSHTFREAFENQRCLVVADGFFEWKIEGRVRKPYYIRARSGKPFGFAGLYNYWTSPDGEELCTTTIITTDANELLLPIHDRMPAITAEEDYDLWLDPSLNNREELLPILKPYPADQMECYPVTSKVNSFKYNDPENIVRLPDTSELFSE